MRSSHRSSSRLEFTACRPWNSEIDSIAASDPLPPLRSYQARQILWVAHSFLVDRISHEDVDVSMISLRWGFDRTVCMAKVLAEDAKNPMLDLMVDLRRHARRSEVLRVESVAAHVVNVVSKAQADLSILKFQSVGVCLWPRLGIVDG